MVATPHPHSLIPAEDIPEILDRFQQEVRASWIRRKFAIDTTDLTPTQLLETFLNRSIPPPQPTGDAATRLLAGLASLYQPPITTRGARKWQIREGTFLERRSTAHSARRLRPYGYPTGLQKVHAASERLGQASPEASALDELFLVQCARGVQFVAPIYQLRERIFQSAAGSRGR